MRKGGWLDDTVVNGFNAALRYPRRNQVLAHMAAHCNDAMRNPRVGSKRTDGQGEVARADHERRAGEPSCRARDNTVVAAMRVENVEVAPSQPRLDREHGRDIRTAFHPRGG